MNPEEHAFLQLTKSLKIIGDTLEIAVTALVEIGTEPHSDHCQFFEENKIKNGCSCHKGIAKDALEKIRGGA